MAIKPYLPLMIVIAFAASMSVAIMQTCLSLNFMNGFMGFFFCLLAMFKMFDIPGFVKGFQMYDVIGKRIRFYACLYPFIELILGLGYLANTLPLVVNSITLVVMIVSAIGVISSVLRGMNVRCACLGTTLNVPLSSVSIVENIGMGIMAAINIALL